MVLVGVSNLETPRVYRVMAWICKEEQHDTIKM